MRSAENGGDAMCLVCDKIGASRSARILELEGELSLMVAEGDEYHAAMVRDDLFAAKANVLLAHYPVYGPIHVPSIPPEAGPDMGGNDNETPWGETGSAF